MLIKALNNLSEVSQKTLLASAVTSGGGTLGVKNVNGGAASWGIQIGETGHERTEVKILGTATPSGTSLIITGTVSYDHPQDTPVYFVKYDQVVFKRSTSGTAGTATAMTGGTVTITADNQYTFFDDTSGSSTYAYKTQFRASVLDVVSTESDWTVFTTSPYSLAGMRQRVRDKMPFVEDITNPMIDGWFNEWRQEMTNAALQINEDYSMGTVDVAFSGTAQEGTITASDFVRPRRVWMTVDGINWFRSIGVAYNYALPDQSFDNNNPKHYMRGDNVIGRLAHDSSGTARIAYDSIGTDLTNDTDELPYSMRGYSKSFIDYALAQVHRHPSINDKKEAGNLEGYAQSQKEKFVEQIAPRDRTGSEYIDIVESTGSDHDVIW